MYGQIHCVIRELVQTKFGNEAWETILRKSRLDEHDSFLMFTRYDDVSTFSLVGAVSDTLGVPVETVLEIFGEFFFDYCLRHGYDKMLRTLGSDIKSFIQNLDSLHSLLALSYKGISAPSFRCEDGQDGELILHYYSARPGLYPIVKGVLKAVARDLFDQSLEMTIIEQNKEDIGCNQSQEHTAFRVLLRTENTACQRISPDGSPSEIRELVEFNPEKILLRATDFCSAFPYHIIFDRDLRIRQCGDLVRKHSTTILTEGMPLTTAFSIVHPRMVFTIENIRKFINAVFLLAIKPSDNGKRAFLLKGQMIWLSDTQNMIFIGSPRLTSLNELMEMNVYLADIPLYDVTRELVLLNQQRIAEIDIAKRLDETTAELKKTSVALEEEKSKTETLLHQMLPRKVATALTHGLKVEAEKFDQVTILFSDIVTFTNIASACSPMDIVNMLNEMYQRFDERTSQHNVYKVETIGDAYMIVSGVPEKTQNHAQPVCNFAMDMVEDAGLVRSPATGLPLQIRVGIHTGPVVAGVVGVKMPRYCLFGDTVNTASRMESHGVPGRIHLSPTTYLALQGWGYAFKHRGEMEVKGKGTMSTYFLCGHLERRLEDPADEFIELDVFQEGTENGGHTQELTARPQDDLGLDILGTDYKACHDGLRYSENVADYDGRYNCCSNSDLEQSPEKIHFTNTFPDFLNQPTGLSDPIKSDSLQSLASSGSQNRLTRNKKISRSSNDSFRLISDPQIEATEGGSNEASKNKVKTTIEITSSSTHTSLVESNFMEDCLYINGSFKNEFRGKKSTESKDGQEQHDSGDNNSPNELAAHDKNISDKLWEKDHSGEQYSTKTVHTSKAITCDNEDNLSNIRTFSEENKIRALSFFSTRPTLSQDCNHPRPKGETFMPVSGSSLHQVRPTSLDNFQKIDSDGKHKRGKKRSKLCSVI